MRSRRKFLLEIILKTLKNKIALITGAARGIGFEIAKTFEENGAIVIYSDLYETAPQYFVPEKYLKLDVRIEQDWQNAISYIIGKYGKIDILVNNAGITGFEDGIVPHDPENISLENWREVHETNLDGVFLGCKYAIKAMKLCGNGSIINISSRSGLVGIPNACAYASSKAAVRNHTKSVALYCAQIGTKIRCNSIHPAAILTPMWEAIIGNDVDRNTKMANFVKDTPLKRFGTCEEVAKMALYLASDASSYVTGSEFNIDGGLLAGSLVSP